MLFVKNVVENVYICIDPDTKGAAVLLKANDEAKLKRSAGVLLGWVRSENEKRGDEPPEVKMYRDVKVADFKGEALMGRWKNWLLLSNKGELAKTIADNLMDFDGDTSETLTTLGRYYKRYVVVTFRKRNVPAQNCQKSSHHVAVLIVLPLPTSMVINQSNKGFVFLLIS